jgi:hypothetical protein
VPDFVTLPSADTIDTKVAYADSNSSLGWYRRGYVDALLNAKQNTITNLADTSKYFESMDSSGTTGWYRRGYVDALLNAKQNTITNLADTSKYFESMDSSGTTGWYRRGYVDALLNLKQNTIPNLSDTSKYFEQADSAGTYGWYRRAYIDALISAITGTFKWSVSGEIQKQDSVRFIAGTNVTLTQTDNTITIASSGTGGGISSKQEVLDTLNGGDPLAITFTKPLVLSGYRTQFTGVTAPASGAGLEAYYSSSGNGAGGLVSYDRDNSLFKDFNFSFLNMGFYAKGTKKVEIDSVGLLKMNGFKASDNSVQIDSIKQIGTYLKAYNGATGYYLMKDTVVGATILSAYLTSQDAVTTQWPDWEDVAGLSVSVTANTTYLLTMILDMTPSAGTGGWRWVLPSGSSANAFSAVDGSTWNLVTDPWTYTGITGNPYVYITGMIFIGSTAGTFKIQAYTGDTNPTYTEAGSYISLIKMN